MTVKKNALLNQNNYSEHFILEGLKRFGVFGVTNVWLVF